MKALNFNAHKMHAVMHSLTYDWMFLLQVAEPMYKIIPHVQGILLQLFISDGIQHSQSHRA